MMSTRRSLGASAAALALVASACGSDSSNAGSDLPDEVPNETLGAVTDEAPDGDDANGDLAAPVPVRVSPQSGGASGGAATSEAASDQPFPVDPAVYAPTIITYVVGDSIGDLPGNDVGWQLPAGVEPTAAQLDALREAFGVTGDAVRGTDEYGTGWRIGPDDGSGPSISITDDGALSWFYEAPYEVALDIAIDSDDVAIGCDSDESGAEVCGVGAGDAEGNERRVAPENVPSADEAQARAVEIWAQLGNAVEPAQLNVYADEWSASVNATTTLGGIDAPSSMSISFGANGTVQHAFGELARPIATGPYPLVTIDEAVERLDEFGWGSIGVIEPGLFEGPAVVGQPIPVESDGGIGGGAAPLPDELDSIEPSPIEYPGDDGELPAAVELTVTLTDVTADLWWSWDAGTIWYLPAYTFIGVGGGRYTVPAVADEFLIVDEIEGIDVSSPVPEPDAVEVGQGDGLDAAIPAPFATDDEYTAGAEEAAAYLTRIFAGSTVDQAEAALSAAGWTVRAHGPNDDVTADFSFGRANVVHVDGIVEFVSIG